MTGEYTLVLILQLIFYIPLARPCTENGEFLPAHTPPPPPPPPTDNHDSNPWDPFDSRVAFDFANYHFVEIQSSASNIDKALDMWAASVLEYGGDTPWKTAQELYSTIDSIRHGDAPWKVYSIRYQGPLPSGTPPKWMTTTYELCTRDARQVIHNQLATADFKDKINYVPYQQFDGEGKRVWSNLMSADWSWKQGVST